LDAPGSTGGLFLTDTIVAEPITAKRAAGSARRPTRKEAENAVRTLLAWAGDDPEREGLKDTPSRVVEAYNEYFSGYNHDAALVIAEPSFEDVAGYDDIVLLRDIRVLSHCEHHLTPFTGIAHVAYFPNKHIAGFSKLARVVDVLARRLQTQEALTAQVADAIADGLKPKGVAVLIKAEHNCMTARGVLQPGTTAVTNRFLGNFASEPTLQKRFLDLVRDGI
jgi:GTP cyclohydrolase I